jgi:hypothetical protein
VPEWGIQSFSPDELRETTRPLLDWFAATGRARVAIHFDVDTIHSNEIVLGLGAEPGGLTSARSPAHHHRHRRHRGHRGVHHRRVHPPTSDAPATTPQRLPAHLRNDGWADGLGDAISWRRTSQSPIRSAHAAGASSSTAVSGAGPIAPLTVRAASMAAGVPSSTIPSCLNA